MNFHILTLFPDMVMQGLSTSIIGRAKDRGLLSIEAVNIRDYTLERHKKSGRLSIWRRRRYAHAGTAGV